MVDLATGAFAFGGILAALHARGVTGRGQRVDLSLLSTGVAWMTYAAQHYFATGEQPQPSGSGHPSLAPYQAFQGSDEKWFVVAVGTDGQFRRLCGVLEIPLAEDPRFATNADRVSHRDELVRELTRRFMSRPAAEWVARLDRAEVPAAPVHEMREVFAHPQVRALGLYAEVPHPAFGSLATVGSAFSFSETPPSLHLAPPMLGQHTAELLTELGYSEAEIARLEAEGAI